MGNEEQIALSDMKNKIEAVLFITGSFMSAEDIAQYAGFGSIGIVKEAIEKLIGDYKIRNTSLEILEENSKYKLALRKDYVAISARLLSNTELDRPTQETLAIIAYKQPILQADLIKIRGNSAYDHIHALKEQEFIMSEKHGRTRMLKLAPKFYDYFDIVEDQLTAKCAEIQQKVGTVEKVETKQEQQATLAAHPEKKDEPDDIQPDPEDIGPEKPEPQGPRRKPDDEDQETAEPSIEEAK
ncbi:MAG TPA: SMC-Scp complex subunit ScpB [Nanoarchaeota archaeon]|nr:SMC-Scp complex subunit ScpB [Nanoarchaeota archaeon]